MSNEIGRETGSKAECCAVEQISIKSFRAMGTDSRLLYDGQIQQSLSVFGTLTDGETKSQRGRVGSNREGGFNGQAKG